MKIERAKRLSECSSVNLRPSGYLDGGAGNGCRRGGCLGGVKVQFRREKKGRRSGGRRMQLLRKIGIACTINIFQFWWSSECISRRYPSLSIFLRLIDTLPFYPLTQTNLVTSVGHQERANPSTSRFRCRTGCRIGNFENVEHFVQRLL